MFSFIPMSKNQKEKFNIDGENLNQFLTNIRHVSFNEKGDY